jgi:hypothetical protein
MEALCLSEMVVSTYKSTWRYNPEVQHRQKQRTLTNLFHKHNFDTFIIVFHGPEMLNDYITEFFWSMVLNILESATGL